MTGTILDVSGLEVSFDIGGEPAVAVDRLGFSLRAGETLGIVGESGSGKSMAALAVMGLIPSPPGSVYSTKDFNRQVKNNIEKFEQDFMFQLSADSSEFAMYRFA